MSVNVLRHMKKYVEMLLFVFESENLVPLLIQKPFLGVFCTEEKLVQFCQKPQTGLPPAA